MEECRIGRVLDWNSERWECVDVELEGVGLEGCRIESVGLEGCRIGRV